MQNDGNLVSRIRDHLAPWSSGTNSANEPEMTAVMEGQTNLHVFNTRPGFFGHPGANLVMQSDGNSVLYSGCPTHIRTYAQPGVSLWSSETAGQV
ncbi:hypothetical protein BV898_18522 [Hypsibius exemplaris]|uniref:Bulb-type lectin domain-containing protein n=1 Tax=Hypsibius exemplaris TaxID=2072580 RepID=A0A9X6NH28_HYPEX|nr:hypothetical protein BV898_18522 [Hypsibius exemplaris]